LNRCTKVTAPGSPPATPSAFALSFCHRAISSTKRRFCGSGLIPESAPFVEQIAAFWSRRHLGRPVIERPARTPRKLQKGSARRSPQAALRPSTSSFATAYPAIKRWVEEDWGWIEVGYTEGSRAFIRALDIGGLIWEGKHTYASVDAALEALDKKLAQWIAENSARE
jgi:hypothetical protein